MISNIPIISSIIFTLSESLSLLKLENNVALEIAEIKIAGTDSVLLMNFKSFKA